MKTLFSLWFSTLLLVAFAPQSASAQDAASSFKDQFHQQFQYASRVLSLAEEIPAETYSWRPGEGVMSVEEVLTHIARYSFYYLESSLDIAPPEDINVDEINSITGKEEVMVIFQRSIDHVLESVEEMPVSRLTEPAQLYGNTVDGQAILMQLITHKSEHVGQMIAYARMNGIVPPWSE